MRLVVTHLCVFIALSFGGRASSFVSDSTKLIKARFSMEETVSLLSDYLKISSITGHEKMAGLFLEEYCNEVGLNTRVFSAQEDKFNFAASLYPLEEKKPNIILLNHIDVVEAGDDSLWSVPPFSGYFDEEYVYGRGALDCKGLAIMQLKALQAFKEEYIGHDLPYNVTLLCVSDEEAGGHNGAEFILNNFKEELTPEVVFGEGGAGYTDILKSDPKKVVFGVSVAEKQSLWLMLKIATGEAGHGASPSLSYANLQMIDALAKLKSDKVRLKFHKSTRQMFRRLGRAEGGIRGFFIRNINWTILAPFVRNQIKNDPLFSTFLTNTVTITNINNPPGPPNQISNVATAVLDCRLVPGTNPKAFIRNIKNTIDNDDVEISIIEKSPDAESSRLNPYFKAIEKAVSTHYPDAVTIPFLFPATSDNSYFRAEKIPAYGLIPGVLEEEDVNSIHNHNERVSRKVLFDGVNIYFDVIREIQQDEKFKLFGRDE